MFPSDRHALKNKTELRRKTVSKPLFKEKSSRFTLRRAYLLADASEMDTELCVLSIAVVDHAVGIVDTSVDILKFR